MNLVYFFLSSSSVESFLSCCFNCLSACSRLLGSFGSSLKGSGIIIFPLSFVVIPFSGIFSAGCIVAALIATTVLGGGVCVTEVVLGGGYCTTDAKLAGSKSQTRVAGCGRGWLSSHSQLQHLFHFPE